MKPDAEIFIRIHHFNLHILNKQMYAFFHRWWLKVKRRYLLPLPAYQSPLWTPLLHLLPLPRVLYLHHHAGDSWSSRCLCSSNLSCPPSKKKRRIHWLWTRMSILCSASSHHWGGCQTRKGPRRARGCSRSFTMWSLESNSFVILFYLDLVLRFKIFLNV